DEDLVGRFLDLLPATTSAAVETAQGRGERMRGREHLGTDADRPLRHAVEPRSHTFDTPRFRAQLEQRGMACVLGDSAGRWPVIDWPTTDFAYARLHGDTELYVSGYDEAGIAKWEGWTRRQLAAGRDTFVYFDNDAKVRAPVDAMALLA